AARRSAAREAGTVTAEVGSRVHRPAAGWLDLEQLERAVDASVQQPVAVRRELGRRRRSRVRDRGAPNPEALLAGKEDVGADVRAERADAALVRGGFQRRVERAVVGLDLPRDGDAVLRLLGERRRG